MWSMEVLLPLMAVGAFAGFIAGLLGIGGGMVVVPIVLWLLERQQIGGEHVQHLALGTSFAVMVFTTFSGALAQHRKGAVRWDIVRRMAPAMVAGGLIGSLLAHLLPTKGLQIFFILFAYTVAVQTLLRFKPKPSRHLPGTGGTAGAGGLFGLLSSWVGIGGGSLSVPFMLYCNVTVHQAVGTSSGLAWPMAVSGAIGYLVSGWQVSGLPAGTLGFWYLPAVAVLAACTVLFAPLGVKVAHKLPADALKTAFGLLLLAIATQMLWKWLHAV